MYLESKYSFGCSISAVIKWSNHRWYRRKKKLSEAFNIDINTQNDKIEKMKPKFNLVKQKLPLGI